jgi:hypothetical protein
MVDDGLWAGVQARLIATRKSPGVAKAIATEFWKQQRPRHLLTGLARCGVCGKPLAAVGRDYLACSAARRQGTCSNRRAIRRELLERTILDALRSRLMQPDPVAEFAEATSRRSIGSASVPMPPANEVFAISRRWSASSPG